MIRQMNPNVINNTEAQKVEEEKQPSNSFNVNQTVVNPAVHGQFMENNQVIGQQDPNKPPYFDKEIGEQYNYANHYAQINLQNSANMK